MADTPEFYDRMLSLGLGRVSEAAAVASAGLIGRGDEKAADQAAVNAMREQLNKLDTDRQGHAQRPDRHRHGSAWQHAART